MHQLLASLSVAAILASGCAIRQAPGDDTASARLQADRLVRAGCYTCLQEALALQARTAGKEAVRTRVATLALLAARVRELGLVGEPDWVAQGRLAAAALPPDAIERLYVDLGAAVPMPPAAAADGGLEAGHRAYAKLQDMYAAVGPRLEALAARDVVAAYFHRLLACISATPRDPPAPLSAHQDVPLVAYRAALCGRNPVAALDALIGVEPRFVEAHFFKASHVLGTGALLSAERELDLLPPPFDRMPAAAFLRGTILAQMEEFGAAVPQFAIVLDAVPGQPRAQFERLRALSYDGQHAAAEQAASALIASGTWFQGEAYYWRAWNRRRLGRLEEAAADVESSKRLLFNAAVPKLAGLIALDRGLLDLALSELTTSLERRSDDCDVHFALGQVHARRAVWGDAGRAFERSAACALDAQAAAEARLREIDAAPMEPSRRERLRARAEHAREAARTQEGQASLNAASTFVLANELTLARKWAQRAVAWPEWAPRARDLLAKLP